MRIIVYIKSDYTEWHEIILRDGLTKTQITNRVNKKFKNWFYWDVAK